MPTAIEILQALAQQPGGPPPPSAVPPAGFRDTAETWRQFVRGSFPVTQPVTAVPTLGDRQAELENAQRDLALAQLKAQQRALDPMTALREAADRFNYETGLLGSPMYAERQRLEQRYAAPARAHELAKLRAQYAEPREYAAQVEQIRQAGQIERERERGLWQQEAARLRGQLAALGQQLAALGRYRASQLQGAAGIGRSAVGTSPSLFPDVTEWFERMTGNTPPLPDLGTGEAVPYSQLEQYARERGLAVHDVLMQIYGEGGTVDFDR